MNPRVRDKLCQILAKYGTSLYLDPRRCENLLRDLCPHHKREVHVLVGALHEKVPADLASPTLQKCVAASLSRLSKRLEDNLALAEAPARWAVETWALALGVVTSQQLMAVPSPRQAPQKINHAPRLVVARRHSSFPSCAIVVTICLLLGGSGVGLAVYWNPSPLGQSRNEQGRGTSLISAVCVPPTMPVAISSRNPVALPVKAPTPEVAVAKRVHSAGEFFPPMTAEEIETARGALFPQSPFSISEPLP